MQKYREAVPENIFQDYEEAASIDQSPTASAALARRCLDVTIKDAFGIKKGTLEAKIDQLAGVLDPNVHAALHAVRSLGNWAVHDERNPDSEVEHVSGEDVDRMLRAVEELFEETYVARERRKKARLDIVDAAAAKNAT